MRCPNCNEILEDDAKFCGYCGYLVTNHASKPEDHILVEEEPGDVALSKENEPEDPAFSNEEAVSNFSEPFPEENECNEVHDADTEKKGKKWRIWVAAGCAVLLLAGGGGFLLWYQSDARQFERAMEKDAFADAQEFYAGLSSEEQQKADEKLTASAQEIYDLYNQEEISYEEAEEELTVLLENYPLEGIQDISDSLSSLHDSKQSFSQAEEAAAAGDYRSAIAFYQAVLESDSRYHSAQEKMQEAMEAYKNQVISQSRELLEAGDFDGAKNAMNEGLDLLKNDQDIQSLRQEISEKEDQAAADQLIADGQAYAAAGDYISAIGALEQSVATGYGSSELLEEYRAAYRQQFFDTAQSYADAGEYEQAIATLNQGVNYFGESDDFTSKIEEYKTRLPISLLDMKVVDSKNISVISSGVTEDIFGNAYTDCILMGTKSLVEYAPNGNYRYLSGIIFIGDYAYSQQYFSVQIYADEVLVYETEQLDLKSDPINFSIDIANARFVRIISQNTLGGLGKEVGISGARFHN
ncbi:MAG TPA: NPCBM/NEW2 domain-containing protein [Firmicutes bacterium]|nr:NPCBM/NEW2 domain-containing protein [Bacillota bacterium]